MKEVLGAVVLILSLLAEVLTPGLGVECCLVLLRGNERCSFLFGSSWGGVGCSNGGYCLFVWDLGRHSAIMSQSRGGWL